MYTHAFRIVALTCAIALGTMVNIAHADLTGSFQGASNHTVSGSVIGIEGG